MSSSTADNQDTPLSNNVASLFSQILEPGSSLHPKFLLVVDAVLAALFLLLLALFFLSSLNLHFLALMCIELALWGSIKWFVSELGKAGYNYPPPAPIEDEKKTE